MNYIISVLPILPVAIVVTAIIYAIIYFLLKNRREKPGKLKMLAEFVLIGWVVMFVYVTQLMPFGNGMGERVNLVPLRDFIVAFRYGSNNGTGVWQFLLNIIMFVPLGFLLPAVSKRFRSWHGVFIVSFLATVATELLQQFTYRGTDIDDVIANTAGGLCGFALYLIVVGIASAVKHKEIEISKYKLRLTTGIVLLVFVTGVFTGIKFCDGSSDYGSLYYGHLVPTSIKIDTDLDDDEEKRAVYKYSEQITTDELKEKLLTLSGFLGEWTASEDTDGTYYSLYDGDSKAIFIFPYQTWSIYYEYGMSEETVENGEKIDKEAALQKAWTYLEEHGIASTDVSYIEDDDTVYSDDNYYLEFSPTTSTDETRVDGNVLLELGQDGRLISITDSRIWCDYAEDAKCISMADSIDIALEVGCGEWQGTGHVESVDEGYAFINSTGYLIPTWQISGYLDSGTETIKWQPKIDAVK